jgi:hypothetical protein
MNKTSARKATTVSRPTASTPAANKSTRNKLAIPVFLSAPASTATRRRSSKNEPKAKLHAPTKTVTPIAPPASKQAQVITMLQQPAGATLADLMTATGWQAHSVRGVISGTLKKRLNLNVIAKIEADGLRHYKIKKHA